MALDWETDRRRGLRRAALVSVVAHAAVMALFLVGPGLRPSPVVLPSVVTVELVAAPPAPAPRPRPQPRAVAPPAPRKVLLPDRPTREVVEPVARPAPEPVARPAPEPKPEETYEDLLAKLRADAGENRPDPVDRNPPPPAPTYEPEPLPQAAPAPSAVPSTATVPSARSGARGRLASPEVVAWVRDARIHVRREWVLAAGFRLQPLETHVEVELDAEGHVLGEPEITRRSGNPWYDESVVRAIQKADPLPAPPEAGRWPFVFRPEDY